MGNITSFAGRFVLRKTRRFNVENRAEKYLNQEKLPAAPKHPSTSELLESITNDPKVREELMRKNTELDENLKQVYVKSLHKPVTHDDKKDQIRNSKLPQERRIQPDFKHGHAEPTVVPKGRYSLAQVIDLLSEHIQDPIVNTPQILAEKYSLDVKHIESMIMYFKLFKVQESTEEKSQKLLTQQVMTSFAVREAEMEKETILKIARESSEFNLSQFSEKFSNREGIELKTAKDQDLLEAIAENNPEIKSILNEEESKYKKDSEDSVYKNVANRKKKKTGS